jgi:hypothetical protein
MSKSSGLQNMPNKAPVKMPIGPMSENRKLEITAQFTDDVLSKLADAFFQVVQQEGWGKRDLSSISGINETAIGHILAGRRRNLTVETIALLTRAMRKRPELLLHDLRPKDNNQGMLIVSQPNANSAAGALQEKQVGNLSSAHHLEKRTASLSEVDS